MVRRTEYKAKKRRVRDDGWRLPDALWAKMERLLPPRPEHPLGCHNPRVPDRAAMDAIFFVLRTGCQWNALRETTICSSSSAHRRFQEWGAAGVFAAFWREGLLAYDALWGIDWTWLALDGAMGKAPLGGEKTGRNPTDRGKRGVKRSVLTDGRGVPLGAAIDGANRNDHKLMRPTLETIPVERPRPTRQRPQHLCLDKGFDYDEPRALAEAFGFTLHLRARGEEAHAKRHA
jgi:putative transposase